MNDVSPGESAAGAGRREEGAVGADLLLLATVGIWSSAFIVTKDQLDVFSPLAFIFARFLPILAVAMATIYATRGVRIMPSRKHLLRLAAAGISGHAINHLCFTLGLDRTSVFSSALLVNTSPIFTLLFLTALGERSPLIAWCGTILATTGVAIFVLGQDSTGHGLSGDLLSLGSAAAFAAYNIILRPFAATYPATTVTTWTMLLGLPLLLLASLPAAMHQDWRAVSTASWLAMLYVIVFPVYIGFTLWNCGLARRGAVAASSFILLIPVLSGILAAIAFDEQFGPLRLAGAALVLAGLLTIRVGAVKTSS
jgi:O-acetylserine/cysteine efflux transporter